MKVHMRYLFALAFLASSSSVSAYQVYGTIGEKWRQLGAESGPLGAPRSDESDAARGGRYKTFDMVLSIGTLILGHTLYMAS